MIELIYNNNFILLINKGKRSLQLMDEAKECIDISIDVEDNRTIRYDYYSLKKGDNNSSSEEWLMKPESCMLKERK